MKILLSILCLFCFAGCKQLYEAYIPDVKKELLIVEGFINSKGYTNIQLSRTTLLKDTGINGENNAVVEIEGEDLSLYSLTETGNGKYVSDNNLLSNNIRYRLKIKTQNGKIYYSHWAKEVITPEIDSITFIRRDGGAEIYVNAYNPQNNTRYYRWNYEEIWEFRSDYKSFYTYSIDYGSSPPTLFDIPHYTDHPDRHKDSIYRCWNDRKSSKIQLGSTVKLSEDRVYQPIVYYPQGSIELSELYTILIRQQGISKECYEFFEILKKNTESVGTIFDAMPSEVRGNLYAVEDSTEIVIGYIDVATLKEKRIFIRNDQLPNWNYFSGCGAPIVLIRRRDPLYENIHLEGRLITSAGTEEVSVAPKICVDCTLRGYHIKPAIWPN